MQRETRHTLSYRVRESTVHVGRTLASAVGLKLCCLGAGLTDVQREARYECSYCAVLWEISLLSSNDKRHHRRAAAVAV